MRLTCAVIVIALVGDSAHAAEEPKGSFVCSYSGSLACPPTNYPGGVCIDGGVPQPKRFTLLLNFDSQPFPRIRLNGLDGRLQPNADPRAYTLAWSLAALGRPKVSTRWSDDGALHATIIHAEQDGGYVSATFKCHRSPKPIF